MNFDRHSSVAEQAKALLRNASSGFGIKASLEKTDNYNRVWARDSAVSGLAILSSGLDDLYPALQASLSLLQSAAAAITLYMLSGWPGFYLGWQRLVYL